MDAPGFLLPTSSSTRSIRLSGILLLACGAAVLIGTLLPWATFTDDTGDSLSQDLFQIGPIRTSWSFALTSGSTAPDVFLVVLGTVLMVLVGLMSIGNLRRPRWTKRPWITLSGPILVIAGAAQVWHRQWWLVPSTALPSRHTAGAPVTLVAAVLALVATVIELQGGRSSDPMGTWSRLYPSAELDERVRALAVAMLTGAEFEGSNELLRQAATARVVGRSDLSCLLQVDRNLPASSVPDTPPCVVAPIDIAPEDREVFPDEPFCGLLQLPTRRGYLTELQVVEFVQIDDLPNPDRIHPTSDISSWGHYKPQRPWMEGWSFCSRATLARPRP